MRSAISFRNRILTIVGVALVAATHVGAQQAPDLAPYLMADRSAEVALARTAAPARISDSAAVLVLTRTGFVQAAPGSNGFTCLVFRSFDGSLTDPNFWSPESRGPACLNRAASTTYLKEMEKRTEWLMAGVSRSEIATRTQRAFASHEFPLPAVGALAYMMSPKQHLSDTNPHWMPHLMFFYDKSTPAAAWGAGGFSEAIIDGSIGDQSSPVLTLLIPVRQWSDGTPALGH
jgi:hypothetical protein